MYQKYNTASISCTFVLTGLVFQS